MEKIAKTSVSELTERIRLNLEKDFSVVMVEGELSNCRPSSTGHLYFTLKDADACISAVMFKNRCRALSFELKDGMLLRVRGGVSVYRQRGTYQIICEEIEVAGEGDILALLERRKRSFAEEGLFDAGRKRRLPRFPETVAIVSSPTGAALQDMLNVLRRRARGVNVIILPCPVQGSEAAGLIARRIEQANQWRLADVIIVGRGGGSLEDLLPFSDEAVVRAVASSRLPVVSAVGHEIDWALCDFAADLRAPTPSAAAELVSTNRNEALEGVRVLKNDLYRTMTARIEKVRLLAKPFGLEDMEYRFRALLQPRLMRFDDAKDNLLDAFGSRTAALRQRLELVKRSLEAGNPASFLGRGFAIVTNARSGTLVRRALDVKSGDPLTIRLSEGEIRAVSVPEAAC